jgi:ankyrin repeat protein
MKRMIVKMFFCSLLLSCTNINRDKIVDKSELTYGDYRLFQNSPAWDLAKAVQDENEGEINKILSKDKKLINYQEQKYGNTLLTLTIINQQMKPFKVLLDNNAEVNIHNTYDGTSPLIQSCMFKSYDSEFAKILIERKANVNDVEVGKRREGNSTRFTPLIAASREGKLDLVQILIKNGANINYENEFHQSALSSCVMQDRYDVTIYLLKSGVNYSRPIFYRPSDDVVNNPKEDKPIYLIDMLREDFFELDSQEYKYKMKVVEFLKSKGVDYSKAPIPDYIKKKAVENYPDSWQEYIQKY